MEAPLGGGMDREGRRRRANTSRPQFSAPRRSRAVSLSGIRLWLVRAGKQTIRRADPASAQWAVVTGPAVRDPRQFVYAVVDGIGWLSRQADLRRIHTLWRDRDINGVFSLAQLQAFTAELEQAAAIHRLR